MLDEKEEWRPVPWTDDWYDVSSHGRVRSWYANVIRGQVGPVTRRRVEPRILRGDTSGPGYRRVTLRVRGLNHSCSIHGLVAEAFVGPRPEGMQVCHNDGNRLNNTPGNLRYDTPKGNQLDRRLHGTSPQGEGHGRARLSGQDVRAMRVLANYGMPTAKLARIFGIGSQYARDVISGKRWAHLAGAVAL